MHIPFDRSLIRQGAGILAQWLSSAVSAQAREASRPAGDLAFCLQILLHGETVSGRIDLHRDHVIRDASFTGAWYEVDLLVRETGSGCSGAVDIDAYTTHDRDPAEFAASRRRWREIRRSGLSLEVVAGDEVRANPWAVALEIADMIGAVWGGMNVVRLPPEVRALAEEYAREATALREQQAMSTASPAGLPSLEAIRSELAAIPVAPDSEFDHVRRRHPRCGAPYTPRELFFLRHLAAAGIPEQALEQAMLRPGSALRRQLRRMQG